MAEYAQWHVVYEERWPFHLRVMAGDEELWWERRYASSTDWKTLSDVRDAFGWTREGREHVISEIAAQEARLERICAEHNALEGIADVTCVPELVEKAAALASDVQDLLDCRDNCGEYDAECPLQDAGKPDSTVDRLQALLDLLARAKGGAA